MGDYPRGILLDRTGLTNPNLISPYHPDQVLGQGVILSRVNGASAVYTSANQACYVPFEIQRPMTITRLWVLNGTAVSGNIDVGIYNGTTRLVSSGSTAQAGTSTVQQFDITDTLIEPRMDLYFAVAMDNVTGTLFRHTMTFMLGRAAAGGSKIQAAAFPLPATATPVVTSTSYFPVIGGWTPGVAI
jgi:hypothetical protein